MLVKLVHGLGIFTSSTFAESMAARRTFAVCLASLSLSVRAQVRVMSPDWLVDQFKETKGRIDGTTAMFGAPFYGERLLGRLVWGDSMKNHSHCEDADYSVPDADEMQPQGKSYKQVRLIHIIMVRRGKCSFVTKVRVAKAKGAHAVIVVDKEDSHLTSRDIRRIIVSDDGYGSSIEIPSLLISRQEGQLLIDAAKKKEQVIIELAWDVPTNHVVIMDLWMSSASQESLRFLKAFAPKRRELNEKVKFVPHYQVFSMQPEDFNELCTDVSASYCAEDPDGSGPITGKMVLDENIRQLCIHELTKVKHTDLDAASDPGNPTGIVEYASKYWDYVEQMLTQCPLDSKDPAHRFAHRFGQVCSEGLMRMVGIDVDKVNRCMNLTGETKLKEERDNKAWSTRALRINGWKYSGTLDADLVTRAICAAFTKQPPACVSLVEPVNPFKARQPEQGGISLSIFFGALLCVAVVTIGALLLYKSSLTRHIHSALREEVMLEVQAQLDTYRHMPS